MPDVESIQLTAFSDSVIASFYLISPDSAEINVTGPPGPPGPPGTGTIDNVTNLLEGDGAGSAVDSGIAAADVVQKQASFTTPTTINEIVACLQAASLCALLMLCFCQSASATDFGDISASTDVSTLWVPPTRTVNGHALSSNVTVTPADLSLVIGTDVQAFDADLTALAALSGTHNIYYRSASNTWSAVTIGSGLDFTGATLSATGGGGSVDDTAFASSWNGVTTTAPSKNAVYDWGHLFDTDDDGKVNVLDQGTGIPITDASGVLQSPKAIGTDIQAWDADLDALAALTGTNTIYYRSAANTWTAVTIGSNMTFSGGTLDTTAGSAGVSDTAFASSWNGVTGTAPSKNAVYDWAHTFDTDDDGLPDKVDLSTAGAVTTDSSGVLSSVAPGSSGNVLTSNGSAWTSAASAGGSGTTSKVSGSDFTTTSGSLVNITGLTYAASANTKYEVDALLVIQNTSSNGASFAIAYSAAGAAGEWVGIGNLLTAGTDVTTAGQALGVNNGTFATTINTYKTVSLKAVVVTGANAGNITVQGLRFTTGTLTVYIGSRMTVTPL